MKAAVLSPNEVIRTKQIAFRSDTMVDAALDDIKRDSFESDGVMLSTSGAVRKALLKLQQQIRSTKNE